MVYMAFYRASKGNIIDWLIALTTWSRYSHIETVLPQEGTTMKNAYCFSASPRDGGTRFANIDLTNGKWEVVPVPWLSADRAMAFCKKEAKCKYDWLGVFAFVVPFLRASATKWFCSEVGTALAEDQGFNSPKRPSKMSPEDLMEWVVTVDPLSNVSR
jgi:hypothetical protein